MILLKDVFLSGEQKDILIKGNLISKILDRIDVHNLQDDNDVDNDTEIEIIDCSNKAILPSFCNTHTHASMMFLRGIGEDKDLFAWLQEEIWPREVKITPEMIYHLTRFAMLEMIKSGTTMFSDMYFFPEETIRAIKEMGIRGAITYCGMDLFDKKKTEEQKELCEKFLSTKSPSARIIKGLSCHAIYTTSEDMFLFAKGLTRREDTYLHIHSSETLKEVNDCLEEHGCRPVELMNDWGVLDDKTILAHCVHLDDDEIDVLHSKQTTVAHCPSSNFKLNSGRMETQKLIDAGLRITLGTDGVSSNNSLSMISEMKTMAFSGRSIANKADAVRIDDIYKIATKNGFDFFGVNAGEIKEGKLADFILVNLNNIFLLPNNNLKSNIIYSADSSCITDVFCDGKAVMRDGKIRNEDEIISKFKKVCDALLK